MKKLAILSLILILLTVTVIPVMAANGNGNGNGNNTGQGNSGGTRGQSGTHGQSGQHGLGHNLTNGQRMRSPFYLQGTISAIGADTITITLIHGSALVKQNIGGEDLVVQVPTTTKIFKITQGADTQGTSTENMNTTTEDENTPGNRVPILFSELEVGQIVAVHGNLVNGVFTARLITVYIGTPFGQAVLPKQ